MIGLQDSEPRATKTEGEPVLYLDFDGVLHHEDVHWDPRRGAYLGGAAGGHRLFEWIPALEQLLQEFPAVRIVRKRLAGPS